MSLTGLVIILCFAGVFAYWRHISADDDTHVPDDPDIWVGPW